jgi:hypothetical protein
VAFVGNEKTIAELAGGRKERACLQAPTVLATRGNCLTATCITLLCNEFVRLDGRCLCIHQNCIFGSGAGQVTFVEVPKRPSPTP